MITPAVQLLLIVGLLPRSREPPHRRPPSRRRAISTSAHTPSRDDIGFGATAGSPCARMWMGGAQRAAFTGRSIQVAYI